MKLVLLFSFASEGNKEANVLLKSFIVIEGAEWWAFPTSDHLSPCGIPSFHFCHGYTSAILPKWVRNQMFIKHSH